MSEYTLSGTDWTLTGWNRHQWHYDKMMETGGFSRPVVPAVPAVVPGSVQTDLLRNGIIEDWNIQLNFRNIEWIEHREWTYEKSFFLNNKADKYLLHFDGLDFNGFVFLNGHKILQFNQMMIGYTVNVTETVLFDVENNLKIVFLQPPEVDGQVGYTSKISVLKSRFNYGWDWCPRLVNIGIFRDIRLEEINSVRIADFHTENTISGEIGIVNTKISLDATKEVSVNVRIEISYQALTAISKTEEYSLKSGINDILISSTVKNVLRWYPNGFGEQPLYNVKISVSDVSGKILCSKSKKTGFRKLSFNVPENATDGCLPYSVSVNDVQIPIRGVNWVPISPFYGSVTVEQYYYFLKRFKNMNCNLLRIWGGATKENDIFYNICDELGLMIWQDFPQSSSGIENEPNEDKNYLSNLGEVAYEYVKHLREHVSLTFWCGGNELYYGEELRAADCSSRNIALLKEIVSEFDSERLFLPCTPSRCENSLQNGDCHGPWLYDGVEKHYSIIEETGSVLYSEIGTPACQRAEMLRKYCTAKLWPPDESNPYWMNRGAWWIQYRELTELFGDFNSYSEPTEAYVRAFRYIQMESLRYTTADIRRKGNKKSGVILWMGNECFPNSANTSILEYDGCPKPAFYAVQRNYSPVMFALFYTTPHLEKAGYLNIEPCICSDREIKIRNAVIKVYNFSGVMTASHRLPDITVCGTYNATSISVLLESGANLVRLYESENAVASAEWIFTAGGKPFQHILQCERPNLTKKEINETEYKITNSTKQIAYCIEITAKANDDTIAEVNPNYFSLLPGESMACRLDRPCKSITVDCINSK